MRRLIAAISIAKNRPLFHFIRNIFYSGAAEVAARKALHYGNGAVHDSTSGRRWRGNWAPAQHWKTSGEMSGGVMHVKSVDATMRH